jgi:peptidoglycan/xylan/chitin deacetylase (PgdA/CDA1 family)
MISRAIYRTISAMRGPQVLRRVRPGAPVFCFHNVVPASDAGVGDASLHMEAERFRALVDWMRGSYQVVPLGELAERAGSSRRVGGLAAITFDDAYRGTFDHALPILEAAGLPSTVFVVSGFPDDPAFTWWDVLAAGGALGDERRNRELSIHRGIAQEILSDPSLANGATDLPEVLLPARWERIVASAGSGVELGSHTVRHANLSELGRDEMERELSRSRQEIRERTGQDPTSISYPYGLWGPDVLQAARRAGYRFGLTLGNRIVRGGEDPFGLPRINIPAGISPETMECWAAGLRLRRPW